MPTTDNDAPQHDAEAEVWSAIAAFEKILEAIPDDRASLETLSHAYEHIGDQTKTLEYLVRLGSVILRDGDAEAAHHIAGKLREFGSGDAQLVALCEELDALLVDSGDGTPSETVFGGGSDSSGSSSFRVADELSFAWRMFEAGELTQEEYASVAQDLSEMSADDHLSTASVLHILEARAFSGMERLVGHVARDSRTPIISLTSFEIRPEVAKLLSFEFMVLRGTVVFDLMGDDALVAVMNPYDEALRKQVEANVGRPCHFYISLPSEFDAVINKLGEGLESE